MRLHLLTTKLGGMWKDQHLNWQKFQDKWQRFLDDLFKELDQSSKVFPLDGLLILPIRVVPQ